MSEVPTVEEKEQALKRGESGIYTLSGPSHELAKLQNKAAQAYYNERICRKFVSKKYPNK